MSINSANRQMPEDFWDAGHPHRLRTWLRIHMPGLVSDLFPKAADCERRGGWHRWYNQDGLHSGCYHCKVTTEGQLWREAPSRPEVQA